MTSLNRLVTAVVSTPVSATVVSPNPYVTAVLSDRPVGFWRLNEGIGSTVATDTGGGAGNGTIGSTVTMGVPGPFVDGQTAAQFKGNAATSKITVSQTLGSAVSLEAWAYAAASSLDGFLTIISRATPGAGLGMYVNGPNTMKMSTFFSGVEKLSPALLSFASWFHLVATYDASGNVAYYVNGQPAGTFTGGGATNGVVLDNIGFGTPSSEVFQGSLANITTYNYVLTPAQVYNHYLVGTTMTVAPVTPVAASVKWAPTNPRAIWRGIYTELRLLNRLWADAQGDNSGMLDTYRADKTSVTPDTAASGV